MADTDYYSSIEEKISLLKKWEESEPSPTRTNVMAELNEEINALKNPNDETTN